MLDPHSGENGILIARNDHLDDGAISVDLVGVHDLFLRLEEEVVAQSVLNLPHCQVEDLLKVLEQSEVFFVGVQLDLLAAVVHRGYKV